MKISKLFQAIAHLFFPQLCCGCDQVLYLDEYVLCLKCVYHLPLTDFHYDLENDSAKQLWGKLDAEFVSSMLYLSKASMVEQLLHKLKFLDYPEIGIYLGKKYGKSLQHIYLDMPLDYIVPIPIHASTRRVRGYNQAECFANGLSRILEVPVSNHILVKVKAVASQTTKSRLERYDNVDQVFSLIPQDTCLLNKHILLVDDVLTTGATLCAAGNLLKQAGARVSIATIARA